MYNTDDQDISYNVIYAIEHQYGTENLREYIRNKTILCDEL